MTSMQRAAYEIRLQSAREYLGSDKAQSHLPKLNSFYSHFHPQTASIVRRINEQDVYFSTVTANMMTRELSRSVLLLLENQSEFDEKYYRLFTHSIGKGCREYKILDHETYTEEGGAGNGFYTLYHAEAVSEGIEPQFREGVLRLGSHALSAKHWTINRHEINLEPVPALSEIPIQLQRPHPVVSMLPEVS
jgi:hypothetical protein